MTDTKRKYLMAWGFEAQNSPTIGKYLVAQDKSVILIYDKNGNLNGVEIFASRDEAQASLNNE